MELDNHREFFLVFNVLFHMLSHFILHQHCEELITITILQMSKWRLRE